MKKKYEPEPVTQEELSRLHYVQQVMKEYEPLRRDIRKRLLSGALVEPGVYCADIETKTERRINQESLAALLEWKAASVLVNAVPRTTRHRLFLTSDGQQATEDAEWKPIFDPDLVPPEDSMEDVPRMPFVEVVKVWLDASADQLERLTRRANDEDEVQPGRPRENCSD